MAKIDMHCHSRYSDRPIHWIFRRIGARESYISPDDLYLRLKERGMDFVTITDHDTIEGALEIAEKYGDAFVSCEFTVRFPGEQTEVHICAYDITEEQFRMGCKLNNDIIAFSEYFQEQGVLTCVPHPLHNNIGQIKVRHLEQLVLLFENFEELNGQQMEAANQMQKQFLDKLSPDIIEELARKHNMQPNFKEPWKKGRLGGTDDHSSFFLGRCWTEVEGVQTYRQFLQRIREKCSIAHGQSMNALEFAHSTQSNWVNTVLDYYGEPGSFDQRLAKLISQVKPKSNEEENSGDDSEWSSMISVDYIQLLIKSLIEDWRDKDLLFNSVPERDLQEDTYNIISAIFNDLYKFAFSSFIDLIKKGKILDAFGRLSLIIPAFAPAVPYIMGYGHFHSDNLFRKQIGGLYGLNNPLDERPEKWAWFTDTLLDINGVTRMIQTLSTLAEESKIPITTMTCLPTQPSFTGKIKNFDPIFHFALPEYEMMTLSVPPLLDILHYCEKEQFTRFIISTPGPVGFLALWVSKILGIPTSAIFHTDLPSYVGRLTNDRGLEALTWTLIRFFYGKMDRVYVLSEAYRDRLLENGLVHNDIRIFPKGTDLTLFHPRNRNPSIWKNWDLNGRTKILYVGRISKEKDLDILHESFKRIRARASDVELVLVGDGPYLTQLKQEMADIPGVLFTGFVEGDELAALYASADIFAFPSTTDTYGSVVLESLASGLPVIVSDKGGPQEVIVDGETGVITRARDVDSFTSALWRLIENEPLRTKMGRQGRHRVAQKSWKNAFQEFWESQQDFSGI